MVERIKVSVGYRVRVGREYGRRRALIFPPLAREGMRGDHRNVRPQLTDSIADSYLMSGFGIGVKQADGNRFDTLLSERRDDLG